jgi:hypothetical protein
MGDVVCPIYSICYGKEDASSAISHVNCYVIIINVPECVSSMLQVFLHGWEIQAYLHRTFVRKVAYTRCDVL